MNCFVSVLKEKNNQSCDTYSVAGDN